MAKIVDIEQLLMRFGGASGLQAKLKAHGMDVSPGTIRSWKSRGKISARGSLQILDVLEKIDANDPFAGLR